MVRWFTGLWELCCTGQGSFLSGTNGPKPLSPYTLTILPHYRAIESDGGVHHGTYHSNLSSGYLYSHYIVWLCLLAVSLCIVLYVARLRRYVKPSKLRNVPSLSFWMPPDDQEEDLLRKEQADYLYTHTKVYVG